MFSLKPLKSFSNLTLPITNLQTLRWRRKPRWLPVAKSKLYKIPTKPVEPEDEKIELMRLNNNYRSYMKSIRRYIVAKHTVTMNKTTDPKDQLRIFNEDFERCSKINMEWNFNIKQEKQKYFEDALEKDINTALESLNRREQLKSLQLEQAEKLVREQKEAAENFITADNIDQAIEHALANTVDYNFAIDLEGNKYYNKK